MKLKPLKTSQFIYIYLAIVLLPLVVTTFIQERQFADDPPIGAYIPPWFGSVVGIIYALGLGAIIHLVLNVLKVRDVWYIFLGYLAPAVVLTGLTVADALS